MKSSKLLTLGVLTLVLAATAGAANIVNNGDFETGDLTGWGMTPFGGYNVGVSTEIAHSGTYAAFTGATGGEATIFQTLTTSVGSQYLISLYEAQLYQGQVGEGGETYFDIFWNGVSVGGDFTGIAHGYQQFTASVTGTGSDVLAIGLRNDPGTSRVDDISVDLMDAPEPASGALLLAGFFALLPAARRLRHN